MMQFRLKPLKLVSSSCEFSIKIKIDVSLKLWQIGNSQSYYLLISEKYGMIPFWMRSMHSKVIRFYPVKNVIK